MNRKFKTTALALVVAFAMSSLVASTASATLPDTDALVSDSAPVKLTGTQENGNAKFTMAGQAMECNNSSLSATVTETTVTEVLAEAVSLTGCTFAGGEATYNSNGCRYRATGTTKADGDARADIECPGTNKIAVTMKAIACEIFVASQEVEEGYTVTTLGSGATKELTMHITVKAKITSKGDPGENVTCASLTNGSATLEGTFLITGETTSGSPTHIGITDETLETG